LEWILSALFRPESFSRGNIVRLFFVALCLLCSFCVPSTQGQTVSNEYYELAQYVGIDPARVGEMDAYFEKALLPALKRQGIENVGVFVERAPAGDKTSMYLLVPLKDAQQVAGYRDVLAKDAAFQKDAESYLATDNKNPVYQRIRSELLLAFDCMPKLKVPSQKAANKDRLFELRTYESSTERMGTLKVEMFNNGEVPIFLDSGIQPVFFGQCVVGDRMPNLTYMTVYDNAEVRDAGWKKFIEHPEWKKLSAVEKYKGTVSKIYKTDLLPRPYSQL
jgi:hypothetical protein